MQNVPKQLSNKSRREKAVWTETLKLLKVLAERLMHQTYVRPMWSLMFKGVKHFPHTSLPRVLRLESIEVLIDGKLSMYFRTVDVHLQGYLEIVIRQ